jgi:hypothetical protein
MIIEWLSQQYRYEIRLVTEAPVTSNTQRKNKVSPYGTLSWLVTIQTVDRSFQQSNRSIHCVSHSMVCNII